VISWQVMLRSSVMSYTRLFLNEKVVVLVAAAVIAVVVICFQKYSSWKNLDLFRFVSFHSVTCLTKIYYLGRRLASGEGIVTLAVTLCVCLPSCLYHVSTAHHISLSGEGNTLYPVLSSLVL